MTLRTVARSRRSPALAATALAVAVGLLAACGASGGSGASKATTTTTVSTSASTTSAATSATAGSSTGGDTTTEPATTMPSGPADEAAYVAAIETALGTDAPPAFTHPVIACAARKWFAIIGLARFTSHAITPAQVANGAQPPASLELTEAEAGRLATALESCGVSIRASIIYEIEASKTPTARQKLCVARVITPAVARRLYVAVLRNDNALFDDADFSAANTCLN